MCEPFNTVLALRINGLLNDGASGWRPVAGWSVQGGVDTAYEYNYPLQPPLHDPDLNIYTPRPHGGWSWVFYLSNSFPLPPSLKPGTNRRLTVTRVAHTFHVREIPHIVEFAVLHVVSCQIPGHGARQLRRRLAQSQRHLASRALPCVP